MSTLSEAVFQVVVRIPAGQVWTYGEIAEALGYRAARHNREVRTAIAGLVRDQARLCPWWRVVANSGGLIEGASTVQQAMLAAEGVELNAKGQVDLARHGRS